MTILVRLFVPVLVLAACGSTTSSIDSAPPATRKLYVGLFGDNAVAVVDPAAAKVITTIAVTAPDGMVITPDGAKLYVSSNTTGAIAVIQTATNQVVRSIAVGAQPAGLAISRDGRYVVAAVQGDGKAAIIDTATDAVVGSTAIGKAHNSALDADGKTAYIASQVAGAPAVDLVGVPGGAPGPTFTLDKAPRALCAAAGKLYVTVSGADAIEVLDAATGQLGGSIATAGAPHDIRPTVDGSQVLTVSQTAGELEIIDPATATVSWRIATGKMPHWIALSSDGKLAYVTNEGDNNLVAIDLGRQAIVASLTVGAAPRKIAVQP